MRRHWALIAASCLGTFAVTASGSARSPLLLDMARDLSVQLGTMANLFGVTSVAWGLASFLAGRGSDLWGRRVFMIGGLIALTVTLSGAALSGGFLALAIWVALAGCCSGSFTGVTMAEISLRVDDSQRGRALGWVMSGQSLTLLVGVPLAAWLGAEIGWRGVHLAVGGLALVAALAMFLTTGAAVKATAGVTQGASTKRKTPNLRSALSMPVIRLLSSLVTERICFGLSAFYYPAYLRTVHGMALEAVALPLVAYAIGNIAGTIFGGQLADRFANRRLSYAAMVLCSGLVALLWFTWHPSISVTVSLGFAFAFFNAMARPSLMAALADVPADVRGTVMGLNSTVASAGWLTAALVGGWMYAGIGFVGFGPIMLVLAILGALLVQSVGRR